MCEDDKSQWLHRYVEVLENLNADNLATLERVLSETITFKDPFNKTDSRAAFIAIMEDMFKRLNHVQFVVHLAVENDTDAFLQWTFYGDSSITGPFSFQGTSVLKVDQHAKVSVHHDYWDGSELMQKVPLIGRVIRVLRSKLGHSIDR